MAVLGKEDGAAAAIWEGGLKEKQCAFMSNKSTKRDKVGREDDIAPEVGEKATQAQLLALAKEIYGKTKTACLLPTSPVKIAGPLAAMLEAGAPGALVQFGHDQAEGGGGKVYVGETYFLSALSMLMQFDQSGVATIKQLVARVAGFAGRNARQWGGGGRHGGRTGTSFACTRMFGRDRVAKRRMEWEAGGMVGGLPRRERPVSMFW